jgi:hypothetical protein
MKNRTPPKWLLPLAASALLDFHCGHAETWQTVLDYQYAPGHGAAGSLGVAADSLGNVFVGGGAVDASNIGHGLVLRTDTMAAAWSVSDDLVPPAPYSLNVFALAFDGPGNLYQSGFLQAPCTRTSCPGDSWTVRKSSDRGQTWSTVESFQFAASTATDGPRGVAADWSGKALVCGNWRDAQSVSHLLVRKSDTGEPSTWSTADDFTGAYGRGLTYVPGIGFFAVGFTDRTKTLGYGWLVRQSPTGEAGSWSTVDLVQLPRASGFWQDGATLAVAGDPQGHVYVAGGSKTLVGSGKSASLAQQWLIRTSSNSGAGNTWVDADRFVYAAGQESSAWGICRDSAGNYLAVGRGHDSQGTTHWIVRRSDAQGAWQTVDDFQLISGQEAMAQAVVTDASGNVLVNGWAVDTSGAEHWIVRRLVP